jgi:hypothetical protein
MESDSYKNLITLLKLFKNRPYHLAKYLLDNSALNKKFIESVLNNTNLDNLSSDENINQNNPKPLNFISISQMEDFYASLIDEKEMVKKSQEEIQKEINQKLDNLISEERFEEAAHIRDWMKMKKIKRISNK